MDVACTGPAALVPSIRPTSDVMIKISKLRSFFMLLKTRLKLSIHSSLAAWLYINVLKPREAFLVNVRTNQNVMIMYESDSLLIEL